MRAREPVCPPQDPSENSLADSFHSSGAAAAISTKVNSQDPECPGRIFLLTFEDKCASLLYLKKEALGMLKLGAEWQTMRANASRTQAGDTLEHCKCPGKSNSPINTAIEKQSWYVVIYQRLTISTGITKLVCC